MKNTVHWGDNMGYRHTGWGKFKLFGGQSKDIISLVHLDGVDDVLNFLGWDQFKRASLLVRYKLN